ncbi:hypothetical protein [Synechococcus sp. CS-603]|uniref:hypothetical protein n=1 Tax=Synechococcus sp. CS-603 TaxID=2847981 RepID=UPI00223BFDAB|nr:hypothetical protein [Synechococcus sp. CS-603]MCT0201810.1 hypothetical protein [Synechococcus sp. CS-603]
MPTTKSQSNHRRAEGFTNTDSESHLMQSGGSYLQGYNRRVAFESNIKVIVAAGVSNQLPDDNLL